MDPAPSPTPSPHTIECLEDHTAAVESYVILAVLAMFLLHVLGSLRRRLSHTILHSIVMGVYTVSYPLVGYTVGLMKSSKFLYEDFAVWAVFLLLLLGSADNLTVCRLSDVDNWKSIHVKHLYQEFLLVLIMLMICESQEDIYSKKLPYRYPLYAIMLVVILKGYVRIASMRMVSKSYVCKKVKVIAEYMQQQHYNDNLLAVPFDPVTMEGYRYIVAGEKYCIKRRPGCTPWYKGGDLKLITVEKIWQCTGRLLVLERGKLLKDLCLSMALSKMLNRRFVGFRLSEAGHEKTHDFVYSYLYQKGRYIALSLPIVMLALCSWLTNLLVKHYESRSVQAATIFVTVVVAFLEAYQLYLYISSGWFKVALIQSYINTSFLRRSRCLEIIIGLLLRLVAFAPWKRNLGQYCILQEVDRKRRVRNCLHYATLRLLDKASKNVLKKSEKVSENVKKTIVDSLLGCNGNLTNAVTSLQNNGVNFLSWAGDATATDGTVARTIVVWHIATTLSEQKLDKQAKEEDAVKTASTLSKYCMHLLASPPNLLPRPQASYSKRPRKRRSRERTRRSRERTRRSRAVLMQIRTDDDCVGDEIRLVAQGVDLAKQLIDNIEDFTTRWKVLSDFWAEMMLYVSPSDDAREHQLEVLAKGGEFITHLWALLTHAGVLKRGRTEAKDVV
ncbi:hypothetical protein SETIT_8G242000v2 [Setaria italica]|uniref:DUF4220 domain-containing protein n=1 Tax=Setaria italica TaxID=4555 RepID=A0A368SB43_SETIT|nr:hypothetical protein SETIT_8G242000v2 [Setaria italica]